MIEKFADLMLRLSQLLTVIRFGWWWRHTHLYVRTFQELWRTSRKEVF